MIGLTMPSISLSVETFAHSYLLWLLCLLPAVVAWDIWIALRRSRVVVSSSPAIYKNMPRGLRARLWWLPIPVRAAALALFICALARPQNSDSATKVRTEGIDIVLAIDVSSSMKAEDIRPNRLEAARNVALEFIDRRKNDRIGVVAFAGESYTQCPVTIDHRIAKTLLKEMQDEVLSDGTAIGAGLTTAIARLRSSTAKSRVVILLTDGVNNAGSISPLTAAEVATSLGVRVYTVGVGKKGMAPYPVKTPLGVQYQQVPVEIDEASLSEMASMTGGEYYRATSYESLATIYRDIDALERSRIETTDYRKEELFRPYLLLGMALLFIDIILRSTYLRIL